GQAVNDLVVCRGSLARLLRLKIFYGQERIGTLRADGIIVSTATGATAYTVSAGGPLIHPELDVCTLTPICPFLSGFTPMVLPFDKEIKIIVDPSPVEPYLTVDGQVGVPLRPDDEVRVFSRKRHFLLVQPSTSSYFKKLKTKGFILED
ncbi:MAG: NAD(+)/NADH kinase, partial [Desulfovibrionales bacterium]